MTRLAHYQLYSCPLCETVYKHPLWASVSIYVPESVNPYLARVCQKCGFQAPLDGWEEAGIVERYTPEELERRGALAMHMFGAGPPPPEPPLLQRIKEAIFGSPEPIDPSAAYPEIVIAETTPLDLAAFIEDLVRPEYGRGAVGSHLPHTGGRGAVGRQTG